ncbi:protein FAM187B-like [Leucoraja erinacea]|uniref:protein FAM187B-like n=1 Tax=Leucoraja erinaceus TaxID=7782 RepID=UPI0024589978|nr:protein FAM187B-like [Leucoraja erinacea]
MDGWLVWTALRRSPTLPIALLLLTGARLAWGGTSVACYPNRPCQVPFLTKNPATLLCPNGPTHPGGVAWVYYNMTEPDTKAMVLVGTGEETLKVEALLDLRARCMLSWPHLVIRSATVRDAGVYLCKSGNRTLAYYEVDMQDAENVHISGKSIGVSSLPSRFLEVGGLHLELFTVWNAWEDCDRCGVPAERRRVGFCYVREVLGDQKPVPCGLWALAKRLLLPRRPPELGLEPCIVPCVTSPPFADHFRKLELPGRKFVPLQHSGVLLIDTYLVNVNGNVSFKCPGASVYTPVSWRRNSTDVSRANLSRRRGSTHALDDVTGRSIYTIKGVQRADEGVYRCYVSEELAGSFHLKVLEPNERRAAAGTSAMGLVWYTLAALALISVLMVFLTFLYTYCAQVRRHQVVHW